jgi:hypothetical protein
MSCSGRTSLRGYQSGLATTEPHMTPMTDHELVSMLKEIFEPNEEHPATEDDLYWQVGNIIGVMDALTQYTFYKVVSVSEQSRHNEQQGRENRSSLKPHTASTWECL